MNEAMGYDFFINVFADGAFAAVAAIGFASISNTPSRAYAACGITAAAGHAVRYVLTQASMNIIPASTVAALVVGLLGVFFARIRKFPAEVCFFPALLPMIPGMYAYRAVEGLFYCMGNASEAVFNHYMYMFASNGLTCVFIVLGMVLGANVPVFLLKKISFQATR